MKRLELKKGLMVEYFARLFGKVLQNDYLCSCVLLTDNHSIYN